MVTLAGTQNFSEFELHARAILGYPISVITSERIGASAVILAKNEIKNPRYSGIEKAVIQPLSDVRIFGKPVARPYRRMAVALAYDKLNASIDDVKQRAIEIAKLIKVE